MVVERHAQGVAVDAETLGQGVFAGQAGTGLPFARLDLGTQSVGDAAPERERARQAAEAAAAKAREEKTRLANKANFKP